MKNFTYLFFICIMLFSCQQKNKTQNKTSIRKIGKDTSVEQQPPPTHLTLKTDGKILLSNITPHLFSSNSQKDTFKLVLLGDSINNATVIFSIISHEGTRIYADTFYSTELFFVEDTLLPTSKVIAGIKERVAAFFDEHNFSSPAYNPGQQANDEDASLWEEIKSDKSAIGFNYHYGEEDDQCIAYSKKQHKVIIYWACC